MHSTLKKLCHYRCYPNAAFAFCSRCSIYRPELLTVDSAGLPPARNSKSPPHLLSTSKGVIFVHAYLPSSRHTMNATFLFKIHLNDPTIIDAQAYATCPLGIFSPIEPTSRMPTQASSDVSKHKSAVRDEPKRTFHETGL